MNHPFGISIENSNQIFSISIDDAARLTGICRSRIYDLINAGSIDARKMGKSTLILGDSLRKFLENLPPARSKKFPVPQLLNQKKF